jgi:hypothetical protein
MNHPVSQVIAVLIAKYANLGKLYTDPTRTELDFQVTYASNDLPDEGDYAIGTSDTEGENENLRSMKTGEPSIRPGVTIQVRAPTDSEASPRAWAIAKYLDALYCRAVLVGNTNYRIQNFSRKYDPMFLMEEERGGRRVWVFRGLVTIFQES